MSDMIQINIQAILDSKSKESILNSINSIRDEINGNPIKLKVETDSDALNAITSKIQTLTSEANSPMKINVDSTGIDSFTEKFKVTKDISGKVFEDLKTQTTQFTNSLGQAVKETKNFDTVISEAGDHTKIWKGTILQTVDGYKANRIEAEKLVITQEKLRASMSDLGSMPISAKPLAINAESLVSGLNSNSSTIDQQEAKLAVDEVINAYKQEIATVKELDNIGAFQQKQIFNVDDIVNAEKLSVEITTLKEKINSLNGNNFTNSFKQEILNDISSLQDMDTQIDKTLSLEEKLNLFQVKQIVKLDDITNVEKLSVELATLEEKINALNSGSFSDTLKQEILDNVSALVEMDNQITQTISLEEKQTLAIQSQQEKYNLLFAEIRGGASSVKLTEDQMVLLQEKLSAISIGSEAFSQLDSLKSLMASMRSETSIQLVADKEIENTRLENVELQRSIALFQERNALALRNIQSQFGSLAKTPDVQSQISSITASSSSLTNVADMEAFKAESAQVTSATNNMKAGLNEAKVAAQGFGADLVNNGIKMVQWSIVGGALFSTLKQIKDGFAFINGINANMTNIAMITGNSHDSIVQMTQDYSALAGQLHETTSEIMTASEEFLRAGNSASSTSELLKSSTVMSKIAGQSQQDSAQSLISVMNSYKMSATDMMGFVDKMVAVDNTSATSTAELSAAIQKTAFSAQAASVSLPELISYIGTISSTTRQSADSIGTSLNVGGLVA